MAIVSLGILTVWGLGKGVPGVAMGVTAPARSPGFTIIIEPFDDRTPTIANPVLHFR